MSNLNHPKYEAGSRRLFLAYPVITMTLSLGAIAGTFFLSTSAFDVEQKAKGFAGIIGTYVLICAILYLWQSRRKRTTDSREAVDGSDIERGLTAFDEAGRFFSGSLKPADAFRLVSSRVRDLIPFQTINLILLNETRTHLTVVYAEGVGAERQIRRQLDFGEGLAAQAFVTRQVEIDSYLGLDSQQEYVSSVAVPLHHGENVFGVMQLYFGIDFDVYNAETTLFEALGTRAAQLMLGAIAYERSQLNALTDITTDLPNERAFYLVLENQVAEAQRKCGERPLTVLAIDIKNFDEINSRFGHAAGDRTLNFVAQIVKDNLRQMDFIARALNDEFLAVLPTATKEISHEIIARIHTGFFGRKFKISDDEAIEIELNIGWSAFGGDGDTPGQLLSLAQLRKEQSKSTGPNKILFFPQELRH